MSYICFNGKVVHENEPVLMASNRSYRYGDGLFETMKIVNDHLLFFDAHITRLMAGLFDLQFEQAPFFTKEKLQEQILNLCHKNNCKKLGRIRLSVSRGSGGLYDGDRSLQYIIECWPLSETTGRLNENGLVIGLSTGPRKSCDNFSNLKSANFLPYSWAASLATQRKWNDCLVLNTNGTIADSTIANCFIIKGEVISTPSLKQACVNGVMRKWLIEHLKHSGYIVAEREITVDELLAADEVFLTNVINGMRWVKQLGEKEFTHSMITKIYDRFVKPLSL